jgi:uncharacterized protein (DUF1015 family)
VEPGDDAEAPYKRAAKFLQDWLEAGVLVEDTESSLYVYRQEFTNPADGNRYSRTGLVCALKLEPYSAGVVLPHEETRTKAKEDRLRLMRATQTNPEPIFGLYEDPESFLLKALLEATTTAAPDLQARANGDEHVVWRLSDPEAISSVQRFLAPRKVWIADGHHRYETALAYRDERRAADGDPASPQPYDYLLVVLSAFNDPGIVVLPTHRLVKNTSAGLLEQLPLQLDRYFTVEPVGLQELPERMAGDPRHVHRFGMVSPEGAWVLTLKDPAVMDAAVEDHSTHWKQLDVSILHTLVLDRSLGIPTAALATTPDVGYTRDRNEALEKVRNGEYQLAFLLNLPTADEVRLVASAGDKMPPKSTFFYPKLWSGLFLRRL